MKTIKGKFQVKVTPVETSEAAKRVGAMQMMFEKSFTGPLTATSTVAMTGLMNKELGSGAYVALEKIEGRLEDRPGSFCLAHASSMNRGTPHQSVTVVPDSGTEALTGLAGHMIIDIQDGEHFYTLTYSLPD